MMDAERITRLLAEGRLTAEQVTKAAVLGLIPSEVAIGIDIPARVLNLTNIKTKAQLALASNATDIVQDTAIKTQADVLAATTGTRTGAQLSGDVRALAQAVSILASNDNDSKKELNALIRLVLNLTDETTDT